MCSNYLPVTSLDRLLSYFGVDHEHDAEARDVFPLGDAPFIRLAPADGPGARPALLAEDGMFGLLPHWAELRHGRKTYNARSETVATLPSFRDAWRRGQRCIVPAEAIYEPCHESGRAVRWRIAQEGGVPLGIAGIYAHWRSPDGTWKATFTMLTINADGHPLMSRMHGADDEKRMVVILDRADYLPWLTCRVAEAARYLRPWGGVLVGEPDALVRPAARPRSPGPERPEHPEKAKKPPKPAPPAQDSLF